MLSSALVGGYLLPSWLLLSCGAITLVVGAVLLASRRWGPTFDRVFGLRVPLWLCGAGGIVVVLSTVLHDAHALTVDSAFWVVVVGVSASTVLTTLAFQRAAASGTGPRLPLWVGVVSIAAVGVVAWLTSSTGAVFAAVFFASFATFFLYLWFVVPLAVYQHRSEQATLGPTESLPTVSVLVPAYNEEGYVGRCIDHLLDSDYPAEKFEVLVVDDGSTDGTFEEARAYAGGQVTVHSTVNEGKHAALNYGLERTDGDIVVVVDADSFVQEDALSSAVATFQDEEVGGVASDVRVVNRRNGVSRIQTLEYILGINTFRRAFDFFGAIPVVPGCLGAFRREALVEAGGYDGDTLTEDFDLTIKVLRAGWTVKHTTAKVWTEAPYSWRDLYRQRLRWNRGNLEVLWKHRDVFVSDDTRYLHRFVFPFYVLTMLLAPLVGVLMLVAVTVGLLSGNGSEIAGMLAFFAFVGSLVTVLALRLEGESLRLVPYALPLVVAYPLFQAVVIAMSAVYTLSDTDRDWASVKRMAQDQTADRA
ncbi:glycosyltransferase [Halomarina salina]|uniref:Glycosyltransferase n=1 Tax=Halomarina salina TaxID=1872699 RepID=A0ABD5RII1_9EURY